MQLLRSIIRSVFYMLVVQILLVIAFDVVALMFGFHDWNVSNFMLVGRHMMINFYTNYLSWASICIFLFFLTIQLPKTQSLFKMIRTLLLIALIGSAIYVVFYSIALTVGMLIISACVWFDSNGATHTTKNRDDGRKF